jgi:hypothetical protein
VIRPLVLGAEATPTQRAQEPHTHPDTVRTFTRRFRQQGMLGLLPKNMEVITSQRARKVPEAIIQEIARLKPLYSGFGTENWGGLSCANSAPDWPSTQSKNSGSTACRRRKENWRWETTTAIRIGTRLASR